MELLLLSICLSWALWLFTVCLWRYDVNRMDRSYARVIRDYNQLVATFEGLIATKALTEREIWDELGKRPLEVE